MCNTSRCSRTVIGHRKILQQSPCIGGLFGHFGDAGPVIWPNAQIQWCARSCCSASNIVVLRAGDQRNRWRAAPSVSLVIILPVGLIVMLTCDAWRLSGMALPPPGLLGPYPETP